MCMISSLFLASCSVVGDSGVEEAPYVTQKSADNIELRTYESMILVSTEMGEDGRNNAFRRLFDYISGANVASNKIAMTAPVFMDPDGAISDTESQDNSQKIAMTAPVFIGDSSGKPIMSFVMPRDFTKESTPKPTNERVWVHEVKNYQVAAITFSGWMTGGNVEEHTQLLQKWIDDNGYKSVGAPVEAAYNGPMTLPWYRKNEILIEVQ